MRTPPGVSPKDFSDALRQWEEAIGKDWVFSSEEDADLYRDAYSPFWHEPEEPVPSAAVAPASVEDIQKILKVANEYKIPLWTISTGKNLAYGGAAPLLSGSVVLDLKRMDKVLEVNEPNAYALVEPGVSYFDLYRYIQDRGLKVWIDPPDPGWGSPMGNSLERGGGRTPMRDHWAAHCGMEVVLANGEVVRTGMGALPGAKTWQQYPYGFGPYVDGMFSQSNFGVVTKMGVWLMPQPEAYTEGTVSVPKHDDLIPFVDTLSYLMNSGIMQGTILLDSPLLNYRVAHGGQMLDLPGGPSVAEMEQLGRDKNLAYWSCTLHFYGPAKVVDAQWAHAQEKFSAIPGATFRDGRSYRFPLELKEGDGVPRVPFGAPDLSVFGLLQSSNGHIGFSPIIPMSGEAVFESLKVFGQVYAEMNVQPRNQFFALPWSYFLRSFVLLFGFPIEHDVEKNRRTRELFRRLAQAGAEHGWGEYRTHTAFMDTVANTYSYNNHALRRFHETIKDAIDPNGILSPGKSGIWPKRMRKV
ncbi:MAG TPA: FAD-binding oxidoreductase [Candidatus Aquilonibacter sp.]|nr:FAD-binding oxidoreductase [Candidatus Aquilonibacter sp.]